MLNTATEISLVTKVATDQQKATLKSLTKAPLDPLDEPTCHIYKNMADIQTSLTKIGLSLSTLAVARQRPN